MSGMVNLVSGQRVHVCYLPLHPQVSILVDFAHLHDAS